MQRSTFPFPFVHHQSLPAKAAAKLGKRELSILSGGHIFVISWKWPTNGKWRLINIAGNKDIYELCQQVKENYNYKRKDNKEEVQEEDERKLLN